MNRRNCNMLVIAGTAAICALGGCDDVQVNWGPQEQRTVRPAPRPLAPGRSTSAPAINPAPATAAREEPGVYQLVLVSGGTLSDAPPGLRHVRLERARADAVGEWLASLVLPAGWTGTARRYALIYPTPGEWRDAEQWAQQMDVAPAGDAARAPTGGLAAGLAELYARTSEDGRESPRLRKAVELLTVVLQDARQPSRTRWAAGMVAGEVSARCLCDAIAADRLCAAAEAVAQPGSYEQMASLYARALLQTQSGKGAAARRLFEQILAQFGAFRKTELFERARAALAGLDTRQ